MHDGQMLFDSTNTWNKQEWGVDETMSKLMAKKKVKDCIVVGVWNSDKGRHADYFPQKPYESLTEKQKQFVLANLQNVGRTKDVFQPVSDNYLKFLVTELKPYIDKNFATKLDSKNTFLAGSSMGGLISMYAICEYPQVFGGAACLSTHWTGIFGTENNPVPGAFYNYLKANLPKPNTHKIYFDYGNQTLDAIYAPFQKQVDEIMKAKGFASKNWQTKFFDGENHSEQSWRKRLDIPLEFLLEVSNH
jgi:enterochelin esterase-like enzyme